MNELLQLLGPDIIQMVTEHGALIVGFFILSIVLCIYVFLHFKDRKQQNEYDYELKMKSLDITNNTNDALNNIAETLKETQDLNCIFREDIEDRDKIIEEMKFECKKHKFKIKHHIKNAQDQTIYILECDHCKKSGQIIYDDLEEIEKSL